MFIKLFSYKERPEAGDSLNKQELLQQLQRFSDNNICK